MPQTFYKIIHELIKLQNSYCILPDLHKTQGKITSHPLLWSCITPSPSGVPCLDDIQETGSVSSICRKVSVKRCNVASEKPGKGPTESHTGDGFHGFAPGKFTFWTPKVMEVGMVKDEKNGFHRVFTVFFFRWTKCEFSSVFWRWVDVSWNKYVPTWGSKGWGNCDSWGVGKPLLLYTTMEEWFNSSTDHMWMYHSWCTWQTWWATQLLRRVSFGFLPHGTQLLVLISKRLCCVIQFARNWHIPLMEKETSFPNYPWRGCGIQVCSRQGHLQRASAKDVFPTTKSPLAETTNGGSTKMTKTMEAMLNKGLHSY